MRLISFALTEPQFIDQSKDVTRRLGWTVLKAGDHLMGCRKIQGRRNGEPIVKLGEIIVHTTRREALNLITPDEVRREGFPDRTPEWFIEFFCDTHADCTPNTIITRIAFRYAHPK